MNKNDNFNLMAVMVAVLSFLLICGGGILGLLFFFLIGYLSGVTHFGGVYAILIPPVMFLGALTGAKVYDRIIKRSGILEK